MILSYMGALRIDTSLKRNHPKCLLQNGKRILNVISICPERIDDDGSFLGHAILLDSQRDTLLIIEKIKERGGHFGSFINLMGDGYDAVAETVSRTLAKVAVKSARNN